MGWAGLALMITALGCGGSGGEPADAGSGDGGPDASSARDAGDAPDTGSEPARVRSTDFAEAAGDVLNPDRGFYWWDWNESASLVLVKVQLGDFCATATLPAS